MQHVESKPKRRSCWDIFPKLRGEENRQRFIVKVLALMICMMLVNVVFVAPTLFIKPLNDFFRATWFCVVPLFIISIVLMFAIYCCRSVSRRFPINYIALFSFNIVFSLTVVYSTVWYTPLSIFAAFFAASVLFVTLFIIGLFIRFHLNKWLPILIGLFIVTIICCIFLVFTLNAWIRYIINWILLCVTCVYTVFDVCLISDKHGLSLDDFVIGALILYMDFVNIFLYILALFGDRR